MIGVPSEATVALHVPAFTFTAIATGQVIVGLILSVTVTVWEQTATFPFTSVTVHNTLVIPRGYVVDG